MFEKQRSNKPDVNKPAVTKADPSSSHETSPTGPLAETPSPSVRRSALIGSSINIKGDVSGDENLIIDGYVEGTIKFATNEVTVGVSGKVNADIIANMIRIDGEVTGDITGHEKVVISKAGNVQGNIVAPRVTLEDGAKFKGSIDMDPSERESGMLSATKPVAKASTAGLSEVVESSPSKASTGT